MATRYWVGGAGTWDTTSTTNWSATSGGASGASAPTSSDDVVFNSASGSANYTVTFSSAVCLSLTASGPSSGSLTFGTGSVTVNGDLSITGAAGNTSSTSTTYTVYGNLNYTGSLALRGTVTMRSTLTGKTFNNTASGSTATAVFNGIGGGWTMSGVWAGEVDLSAGTLDLGSTVITYGGTATTPNFLVNDNANTKVLNLNAASITTRSFDFYNNSSSTTIIAGTSTLSMYSSTSILSNGTFNNSGNFTFNNFVVSPTSSTRRDIFFTGNSTFNNFTVNAPTSDYEFNCNILNSITVTGTLTVTGGTYTRRVAFLVHLAALNNRDPTTSASIVAANKSLSYVDFYGINASGAAAPFSGTSIGDAGGNTGITGDAPKTIYWNLLAGGNYTANAYATSSGGAVSLANFPLPQDTLIIDNAGLNSGAGINFSTGSFMVTNITSTRTVNWVPTFNGSRFFGNITIPAPAGVFASTQSFQGFNKTIVVGSTINGTSTFTTAGTVTFSASSFVTIVITEGTCVLGNNTLCTTRVTLTKGTLNLNNFLLEITSSSLAPLFTSTNFNTRSIAFGSSGVLRINSGINNGDIFNINEPTGFSYTGTSNVQLSGTNVAATSLSVIMGSGFTESQTLNFTVLSGNTYSFTAPSAAKNLTIDNGFAGSINDSSGFARVIYGNLLLGTSVTVPSTILFKFGGASGTKTITTAGKAFKSTFDGTCTWEFQDALTASSSTMTLAAGTVKLKSGTTNTIGTFATTGTTLKYLASTTAGSQATISQASGTVAPTFLSIKDSNATGGAIFDSSFANGNVNAGNNTGWDFGVLPISALISESLSLQDASSPTKTLISAISETLGLADPSVVAAAFASAASEATTLADSPTAGTAFVSSILEGLVAADSTAVLKTFNVSISEPQTIAAAANVIAAFISDISEPTDIGESIIGVAAKIITDVTEAISVSDAQTAVVSFVSSSIESISVADSETVVKTQYAIVVEPLTLNEQQDVFAWVRVENDTPTSWSLIDNRQ